LDGVGMTIIERTRDVDGTANASGFHVWRWYASSTVATTSWGSWSRVYAAQSQTATPDYGTGVFVPDLRNIGSAYRGTTAYAFPAMTYAGITPGGASQAVMFAFPNDFPRGNPITVTHYGQSMTFVPLADAVTSPTPYMNTQTGPAVKDLSPMIRWD